MIRQEEVYKIGKIGKPHGVKGELTLFFDDDVFDRVDADYPRAILYGGVEIQVGRDGTREV